MMLEHLGKKIDEIGLPDGLITAIDRFDARIDKISSAYKIRSLNS